MIIDSCLLHSAFSEIKLDLKFIAIRKLVGFKRIFRDIRKKNKTVPIRGDRKLITFNHDQLNHFVNS